MSRLGSLTTKISNLEKKKEIYLDKEGVLEPLCDRVRARVFLGCLYDFCLAR